MAEESAVLEPEKKEGTGKIMSAGKVQSFNPNIQLPNQQNNEQNQGTGAAAEPELNETEKSNIAAGLNKDGTKSDTAAVTETPEEIAAKAKLAEAKPLTDEELKKLYEERFPTQAALTDEEKAKQDSAFEKRMLDLYIDAGGKIEEFTLLKHIASQDLTELNIAQLTKQLKELGITDPAQIAIIQKERLEQLSEEELEQFEDESAKDFAKRKREYDKKQIESRSSLEKESAQDTLNNLREAVNQKDLFTQKESEFVSNVEAHFKEVPRKMTLELGKMDDIEIAPVEYEVPEDAIAKAEAILKNPKTRKELLFNTTDGSLNLKSIAQLVLKAEMFDSAAKTSYLTGGHREVEKFEAIFPKNPNALGVGGNNQANNGKAGKIVSAGQPTRFKPAVNQ